MKSLILKICICLVILLFTLYAPIELTRYVLAVSKVQSVMWREFITEIVFMWVFYIAGMILAFGIYRAKKELRR